MNILVINSGSSSIKFSIFASQDSADPRPLLDGQLSGIATPDVSLELSGNKSTVEARTSADAIHLVFDAFAKPGIPTFEAVGYRVVHPGPKLDRHQRITDEVLRELDAAAAFAPLHDPDAVKIIREAMQRFPSLPHFACFDTVFHQTMPESATTYPIPLSFRDQGVRRYGFHGLSCESVVHQLNAANIRPESIIIAHLGSGCSVTTVMHGQSIDTSMGLTPTGGVVMGTRPGDLDPGLIFYLLRQPGATIDSVEHMLNHDAGLKALSGTNDMRVIDDESMQEDDLDERHAAHTARLIFSESVRRVIGGMAALYTLETLVFTGGIGEHDADIRWTIGKELVLNEPTIQYDMNKRNAHNLRKISDEASTIPVYVVPAEEDLMIAMHVARMSASDPM